MKINSLYRLQNNNCIKAPVVFKRSIEEHKSWGASVDPTSKDVSFKIFSYPDASRVDVKVFSKDRRETKTFPLENCGEGVFKTVMPIPSSEIKIGDNYFYSILRNGTVVNVKDPYSCRQKDIFSPSSIYDHSLYKWHDDYWFKENKGRISRIANGSNGLLPVQSLRIYEMHIGTISKEGTFDSAKKILKKIKDNGFNAIEIMPVEGTYSFNWGYDGVDKFAPSEHLGGPDKLKSFVDCAHNLGLNVIMDMVPNHMGPEGNYLRETGPYISSEKNPPFGDKFNYYENNSKHVRDFMVNAALNWAENYHCDGLRLDLTSDMNSDSTMQQIAAELNYHKPDVFLIAEDGRVGDIKITKKLLKDDIGANSINDHIDAINNIESGNLDQNRLGFDTRWDFAFFHALNDALLGRINLDNIEYTSDSISGGVKYLMSHDEIGNHEGTRLVSKLITQELDLSNKVILDSDDYKRIKTLESKGMSAKNAYDCVRWQKTQLCAEKLSNLITSNNSYLSQEYIKLNTGLNDVSYSEAIMAFKNAFEKSKMGIAIVYSTPGAKMVFQGDENLSQTPFRFFREFKTEYPETSLHTMKGYDTGEEAYKLSNMENKHYSSNAYLKLVKDLNSLNIAVRALSDGHYLASETIKHPVSGVLGMHIVHPFDSDEIFTISNFKNEGYESYDIHFPNGVWSEIINTNSKEYSGDGRFQNKNDIVSQSPNGNIVSVKIPPYSTLIFKKL